MPETPRHVGDKVEEVFERLNARWDLQLPRLHGLSAEVAERDEKHSTPLDRKCAGRIRYLCFRPVNLTGILEDFEEQAKYLRSQWVFKPSQEKGTLANLPIVKSNIAGDNFIRGKNVPKLTAGQRNMLLQVLDKILKDDYELARLSDSYSRSATSESAESSKTPSGKTSFVNSFPRPPPPPPPAKRVTRSLAKEDLEQPRMKNGSKNSKKRSPAVKDEVCIAVNGFFTCLQD